MTRLLEGSQIKRESIVSLSKVLHYDREAFLQLLLSLSNRKTLNRIVCCPTYPVRTATKDLTQRLELFKESIALDPHEISLAFAVLYESAVERNRRKNLGQYFTPTQVAKEAVAVLDLTHGDTVLDPGCGTGIFATTIQEVVRNDGYLPTIRYLGIENDPILTLSTAISLDWVDAPKNWRVLYDNFLRTNGKELKRIGFPRIDAIIANPPFVRFHRLGERSETVRKLGLSMFSGLHAFFLAHSAKLLRRGRMAFILPMEMSNTRHGIRLMKSLKHDFIFNTKVICYDQERRSWSVKKMQRATSANDTQLRLEGVLVFFSSKSNGREMKIQPKRPNYEDAESMHLASFARVHRGISTGANDFFIMTDESVRKMEIPDDYLKKVIPTRIKMPEIFTLKYWDELRKAGKPCWLLYVPPKTPADKLPSVVRRYLRIGERKGINLIYTCRKRKPWYSVRISDIPDLLFTYISRGYPRFVYNNAQVHYLTNLLGVYFNFHVGGIIQKMEELIVALNRDLRNWVDRESTGRRYAGGLIKFEPRDIESMPVSESIIEEFQLNVSSLDFIFDAQD